MNTALLFKRADYCAHYHPALADAVRLAVDIVLAHGVTLDGSPARVKSASEAEQTHIVNVEALTCDCADYPAAPLVNGTRYCEHLLAALLAETKNPATPAISRQQWDAFYRERERHELVMRAVQAGVKILI